MDEKEKSAIAFMIDEIDAFLPEKDNSRRFFESLKEQFTNNQFLSEKQIKHLSMIYERVTS